jgi:hypothetical protein
MTATKTTPAPETALAKPYEPTPREFEAREAQRARKERRMPAPRLKMEDTKAGVVLDVDHPDKRLGWNLVLESLATADLAFADGLLKQIINAATKEQNIDEDAVNFMLAMVRGLEPKDHAESMLAVQMAAVHSAAMNFARRLNHVDNIQQQDSAASAFNKLTRTFAVQVEALKRYRTGGEQRVLVQHVNVNEGGQAIVGNVTGAGPGGAQKPEASP